MANFKVYFKNLQPYCIVVFAIYTPSMDLIKRIIALPGETVSIDENGKIRINGEIIEDPFAEEAIRQDMRGLAANTIILKDNEYFVMGDNRNASTDSRTIGPIQKKQIIGKVRVKR